MSGSLNQVTDLVFEPSQIENIDLAVYNWVNEDLNLFCSTNKGWNKAPVIWVSGERSWQVKNNRDLRDGNNNFILPVITIERTEISKEKDKKGKYWGDIRPYTDEKGGSIAIHTIVNQKETSKFANAYSQRKTKQPNFKRENQKVVYETKFIPMPVYVTMTYVIDIKTEYQQQMNELMQPFLTYPGGANYLVITNEEHRYEAFIDGSISQKNNLSDMQENERLFNSQITIKVLGHLVGMGKNDLKPKIVTRQNIVEVYIGKEYEMLAEEINAESIKTLEGALAETPADGLPYVLDSDGKYIILVDDKKTC